MPPVSTVFGRSRRSEEGARGLQGGYPGLSAFSRSDGFQLRLHFFRRPRLGLRAIGLRARPRALDHRLWFLARTRLFHCPLRKESFLVAHIRPPVTTYLWSPRTKE